MVLVTELVPDEDCTFRVVGEWQFARHTDAAVHLYALLGYQSADAIDGVFSCRHRAFTLGLRTVERRCRVDGGGAGLLDLDGKVDHAMLQRLEFADRDAELLAGPQSRRLRRRFFGARALRREAFDHAAVTARLQQARSEPERLRLEARALLSEGVLRSAAALDALLVECLALPGHAPGPLEDLFAQARAE